MSTPQAIKRAKDNYYKRHKARIYERYKAYRSTPKGFLLQTYENMQRRVRGKCKGANLYTGLPLLERAIFYQWALESAEFIRLFENWDVAARPHGLTPSIDRIDSSKGYVLANIRWVTQSENSRAGARSRWAA